MSISSVPAVRSDINDMLAKIRDVSTKNNVFSLDKSPSPIGENSAFKDTLSIAKTAFDKVNTMQAQSDTIKDSFVMGDRNVSMSQVVMASQKSKLAFEGLITVRNKLLEAYKEVMNMQV